MSQYTNDDYTNDDDVEGLDGSDGDGDGYGDEDADAESDDDEDKDDDDDHSNGNDSNDTSDDDDDHSAAGSAATPHGKRQLLLPSRLGMLGMGSAHSSHTSQHYAALCTRVDGVRGRRFGSLSGTPPHYSEAIGQHTLGPRDQTWMPCICDLDAVYL